MSLLSIWILSSSNIRIGLYKRQDIRLSAFELVYLRSEAFFRGMKISPSALTFLPVWTFSAQWSRQSGYEVPTAGYKEWSATAILETIVLIAGRKSYAAQSVNLLDVSWAPQWSGNDCHTLQDSGRSKQPAQSAFCDSSIWYLYLLQLCDANAHIRSKGGQSSSTSSNTQQAFTSTAYTHQCQSRGAFFKVLLYFVWSTSMTERDQAYGRICTRLCCQETSWQPPRQQQRRRE